MGSRLALTAFLLVPFSGIAAELDGMIRAVAQAHEGTKIVLGRAN